MENTPWSAQWESEVWVDFTRQRWNQSTGEAGERVSWARGGGKAAVKGRAGPLAESSWCGAEEAGRVQEGREEGLEMWLGTQLEWDGVGIKVPFVNLTSALMRGGLPVWLRVWSRAGGHPPSLSCSHYCHLLSPVPYGKLVFWHYPISLSSYPKKFGLFIHWHRPPRWSRGGESAYQCRTPRRAGCYPWLRRSPGGGNDDPLQCSRLENPVDRGAWQATRGPPRVRHDWVSEHTPTHPLTLGEKSLIPFWGLDVHPFNGNILTTLQYIAWVSGLCAESLQSYPTLCSPVDCSPTDSSVHGVLQVRILEWVTIPSSRGSSLTRGLNLRLLCLLDWLAGSLPLVPPGLRIIKHKLCLWFYLLISLFFFFFATHGLFFNHWVRKSLSSGLLWMAAQGLKCTTPGGVILIEYDGNYAPLSQLSCWRIHLQCGRLHFDSWVRKICWRRDRLPTPVFLGLPNSSVGKEFTCTAGDLGSNLGLGRSPGEGNSYPLQYSGLENSMDYTVHAVAKSQTRLSDFHFQCPLELCHVATLFQIAKGYHFQVIDNLKYC